MAEDGPLEALKRSPLFSETLGIDLARGSDGEYFKWFLASLLYGGRISATIAEHTYRAFEHHGLLDPQRIQQAGWDYLVNPIMREGGYVRYDGRKSTQILRGCETLLKEYHGSLSALHAAARDPADLEARIEAFYGVGPVTANIFLRELRPHWRLADPEPLPAVQARARALGIDLAAYPHKSMTFVRIEAGLLRLKKGTREGPGGA